MRFSISCITILFSIHLTGTSLADMNQADLEFLDQAFDLEIEDLPDLLPDTLPGSEQNVANCEGYLTSNPNENFCSKTVPEDWTSFEFNGQRIYKVPLEAPAEDIQQEPTSEIK